MSDVKIPRVFIDADTLFAGVAGPTRYGASLVVLRMAEITLVEAITCQQVIDEVERNLTNKIPTAVPAFHLIVSRCLQVTPTPSATECRPYHGLADPKDLPILVAAVRERCPMLITFNGRHFQPGHPDVLILRPGEFIRQARYLLSQL